MQNFHSVGEKQSCTRFHYSSDTANLLEEHFISQNFHLANGKMRFPPFLYYLNQTLSINLEHTTCEVHHMKGNSVYYVCTFSPRCKG